VPVGRLREEIEGEVAVNARKPQATHPKGWEPGLVWDGERGHVTSEPVRTQSEPDFDGIIRFFGYDPALYEVDGSVQHRAWQQKPGEDYLYYYRATIVRRGSAGSDVDLDALAAAIAKRKPRKPTATTGNAGLVLSLADWQVGKADGGGVLALMERLDQLVDQADDRVRSLKKLGVPLEVVYPCFMGDLFESCSGHYAQQAFRTELNIRDQRKVIRWAADRLLDRLGKLVPQVAVKVVGGNHGEEREGGKSHTDFADNRDVAVIEDIAYAYAKNPDRYGHIAFAIPSSDLTLTFDHHGYIVGLAHGHQAGFGSGDPKTKINRWWLGQMEGQQAIGDADLLLTAHYHHPWMVQAGTRTHFGSPTLDGGSDWFRHATGKHSPPGTLSFVVTADGWDHMNILRPDE
jgi:hypothetical protein